MASATKNADAHQPFRWRENGESGLFYAGYRRLAIYNRAIGNGFLICHDDRDPTTVECKRHGYYLYLTLAIRFIAYGLAWKVYQQYVQLASELQDVERFHALAYWACVVCVSFEAILNYWTALKEAPRFLGLIQTCSRLEQNVNAPLVSKEPLLTYAWRCIALQVALNVVCLNLALISEFGLANLRSVDDLPSSFRALVILTGMLHIVALVPQGFIIRASTAYYFRVFRVFVQCIGKNVGTCLQSFAFTNERKVAMLQELNSQLNMVRDCVHETSAIMGTAMLYTYCIAACFSTAAIFYIFIPKAPDEMRIFFLGSGLVHFIGVLVPTLAVHQLAEEVSALRNHVFSFPTATLPRDLLEQVTICAGLNVAFNTLYFHWQLQDTQAMVTILTSTLNSEGFRFSVNEYFDADLGTLTTIMGVAMTYSLVLVQTHGLRSQDRIPP